MNTTSLTTDKRHIHMYVHSYVYSLDEDWPNIIIAGSDKSVICGNSSKKSSTCEEVSDFGEEVSGLEVATHSSAGKAFPESL